MPKADFDLQHIVPMTTLTATLRCIVLLVIFDYVRKLEKTGCACSADWRRTYIMYYTLISVIYDVLVLTSIYLGWGFTKFMTLFGLAPLIYFGTSVVFIIAAFQYVNRLKREKCACSEAAGRTILQLISWFYVILWAVIGVLLLFLLVLGWMGFVALQK